MVSQHLPPGFAIYQWPSLSVPDQERCRNAGKLFPSYKPNYTSIKIYLCLRMLSIMHLVIHEETSFFADFIQLCQRARYILPWEGDHVDNRGSTLLLPCREQAVELLGGTLHQHDNSTRGLHQPHLSLSPSQPYHLVVYPSWFICSSLVSFLFSLSELRLK